MQFKWQLLPYNLYKFAKSKQYLDPACELLKDYRVEIKYGLNDYKGTHDNFVNIIGSSKSVHDFYKEIMRRKCESSDIQNEEEFFKDAVEWPPHYIKWLQILDVKIGKLIWTNSWSISYIFY